MMLGLILWLQAQTLDLQSIAKLVETAYRTPAFAEVAVYVQKKEVFVGDGPDVVQESVITQNMLVGRGNIKSVAYDQSGQLIRATRLRDGMMWEYYNGKTAESQAMFPSGVSMPYFQCSVDCDIGFCFIQLFGVPRWEDFIASTANTTNSLNPFHDRVWPFQDMEPDVAEDLYRRMDWAGVWSAEVAKGVRDPQEEENARKWGYDCYVVRTNDHVRYISKGGKHPGLIIRWDMKYWADEEYTIDGGYRIFRFDYRMVEAEVPTDVDWSIPVVTVTDSVP